MRQNVRFKGILDEDKVNFLNDEVTDFDLTFDKFKKIVTKKGEYGDVNFLLDRDSIAIFEIVFETLSNYLQEFDPFLFSEATLECTVRLTRNFSEHEQVPEYEIEAIDFFFVPDYNLIFDVTSFNFDLEHINTISTLCYERGYVCGVEDEYLIPFHMRKPLSFVFRDGIKLANKDTISLDVNVYSIKDDEFKLIDTFNTLNKHNFNLKREFLRKYV